MKNHHAWPFFQDTESHLVDLEVRRRIDNEQEQVARQKNFANQRRLDTIIARAAERRASNLAVIAATRRLNEKTLRLIDQSKAGLSSIKRALSS